MTNETILLVEENPDDRVLIQDALAKSGLSYQMVALDTDSALEYLFAADPMERKPLPVLPHLILLNLENPVLGGMEVLRRVRADERTNYIPVVILASSPDHSELLKGYRLGANSIVCKPVEFDELAATMQLLGMYWLTKNQTIW